MAEKESKKKEKKKESKIILERTYNVPLRREWLKAPKWKRAKKAVKALREFVAQHMKAATILDVKVGKYANQEIWKQGIRSPPHHIKLECKKNEDGIVFAELVGAPKEEKRPKIFDKGKAKEKKKPKAEEKKKEAKKPETKEEKILEKEKELEGELKEIKEEKAEKAKGIEKEEIKEMEREHHKEHPQKVASKAVFTEPKVAVRQEKQ